MTGVLRTVGRLEDDDRWARAALSFLVEPRNGVIRDLLAEHGGAGALAALRERRAGSAAELYVRLPRLDLDGLVADVARIGAQVLVPGDDRWPPGLDRLKHPPYCLFVGGEADLASLTARSVSVVGSRAATAYGRRVAAELGEELGERGWTVVSGAAYGIDVAAHRGALAAGAPTVAVLACGVDVAYPRAHERDLTRIAESGAVVSEVPPGSPPYRGRFLARNRLIAAMSRTTVVVEAGLRSGSLVTARDALECHLPVGAVPGPVTSVASAGCHRLLRDTEAVLVTDVDDVLDLAAPIGEGPDVERRAPRRPTDDLDPLEHTVWSVAPMRRRCTPDRLAELAGVDPAKVPGALAVLEALGLVESGPGGYRKKSAM
ncbi:DNA-protecting protein DprA [Phycicoccus sp. CSK15P-2]|uniref:DNA-processing protein DprA n=1 Tax=Phycicoccus sp. CSK15P-2 TaxID=2807627 RepID=UPI0019513C85|nr:DNA-processing protein DprA [Phycicoccus sp. CSK15P-2]MBM6404746.1 DNA-protecting protein DprA [Phycicoccus sp. CSK15P-2]